MSTGMLFVLCLGQPRSQCLVALPIPSSIPKGRLTWTGVRNQTVTLVSPFGSLPGFETTRGIVAPPKDPIHGGYVYDGGHGKNTKYILLASMPG